MPYEHIEEKETLIAQSSANGDWRRNLSALPDIAELEQVIETLSTGETVIHRKVLPFVAWHYNPKDIFMFTDHEGQWFVVYGHEGGPHKRRA